MKNNRLLILFFSLFIVVTSCKDFLDLEPKSAATDENFWKTQDDANAAVAGMYALLRSALNGANGIAHYAYGDLPSDEIASSNTAPYNDVVSMNWSLFVAASNTGHQLYQLRRYDSFYRVIDQANRVIEHAQKMDVNLFTNTRTRDHLIGEAYYMRAFAYFYLGRIWGGVPIITEAVQPIYAENKPAATAAEVLAQSLQDLEVAKKLLGWRNIVTADFALRANKGAAFALEAHANAWLGNYEKTAAAADSVIKSGLYSYVSRDSIPYRTIFQGKSAEGIFEISQSAANEGTSIGIGDYTLASSKYHRTLTVPRLTTTKIRIDSLFKERVDKRRKYSQDTTISTSYVICNKYANLTYPEEGNNAVPVFKNNIIIFRYSDIKLLRAEALAALGRTSDAKNQLNEVRLLAGLGEWDGKGELLKAVFDERARELFLEGHRFYDMIRLYKAAGIYEFSNTRMTQQQFALGKYYWPFDPSMLNQNPFLRQTSYWATVGF